MRLSSAYDQRHLVLGIAPSDSGFLESVFSRVVTLLRCVYCECRESSEKWVNNLSHHEYYLCLREDDVVESGSGVTQLLFFW